MQYDLTDRATIEYLLKDREFRFAKSMGQNFIIDPEVCPSMVYESGIDSSWGVIEIGPGIGVLTSELCKAAGKVAAIELDRRLIGVLSKTLADFDNVKVIEGDALKTDLKQLIDREFPGMRVCVCANLPYYITSPLIMHLLESRCGIEFITVMVQKEAADRLCAPVGSRDSGAITVAVNYYSEAKKLFDVSKNSFMPAPKVNSSVIKLDIREKPPVEVCSEEKFFALVKAAFGQRRKTAVNSLSAGLGLPKEKISGALTECDFSSTIRAEVLTMEELAKLCNALYA